VLKATPPLEPGGSELLLELKVKALGIIEEIDWKLGHGLNVISGETGAGKSLVIDAIEALLGGKVDEENIRMEPKRLKLKEFLNYLKVRAFPDSENF